MSAKFQKKARQGETDGSSVGEGAGGVCTFGATCKHLTTPTGCRRSHKSGDLGQPHVQAARQFHESVKQLNYLINAIYAGQLCARKDEVRAQVERVITRAEEADASFKQWQQAAAAAAAAAAAPATAAAAAAPAPASRQELEEKIAQLEKELGELPTKLTAALGKTTSDALKQAMQKRMAEKEQQLQAALDEASSVLAAMVLDQEPAEKTVDQIAASLLAELGI
jgi:hypothetical protein